MKTQERLERALITLMKKKSFDRITISDICKEAYTSRPTFYAYYTDKYDLLNTLFDRLFDDTVLKYKETHTWKGTIEKFLHFLQKEKKFFLNAYSYKGQNCLFLHHGKRVYEFYYSMILENKKAALTEDEIFSLKVYVRGAMTLIHDWIERGFDDSITDLEKYFKISMPSILSQYLLFSESK